MVKVLIIPNCNKSNDLLRYRQITMIENYLQFSQSKSFELQNDAWIAFQHVILLILVTHQSISFLPLFSHFVTII